MPKSEHFLLDTHIWVWLLNGDSQIQQSAVFPHLVGASRKNALYISAISIWEVEEGEAIETVRRKAEELAGQATI